MNEELKTFLINSEKRIRMKTVTQSYLVSLATGIALFTLGCSETKVAQCKKIIVVTKRMEEVSKNNRQTHDLDKILQVVDNFEKSAAELEQMDIADKKLSNYKTELVKIYQGNSEATRQFVSAFQEKDITQVSLAQKQVQIIGKKEQQLVGEINQYCQQKE